MKIVPTMGFVPIHHPIEEKCNLVFFYPLKPGKSYTFQGSSDCGDTYSPLFTFEAVPGQTSTTFTYNPNGPVPRLIEN